MAGSHLDISRFDTQSESSGGAGGGAVDSVGAADATITVSGTTANPLVAVTPSTFDPLGYAATAQSNAESYATTAASNAQANAQTFATNAVATETTRAEAAEALLAPKASPTFTGIVTAPEFTASGLTGATAATRYVGGTASGAPASGTFAVGDFVIDQTAAVWVCTTAGTPGTWTKAGGSGATAIAFGTAAARPAAAAGNSGTAYFATDTSVVSFSDGSSWHNIGSIGGPLTIPSYLTVSAGQIDIGQAGRGLAVAEGANAKQGTATLSAGAVVVANTNVTANSRIFLTGQVDGGTPGWLRVSTRTAGTSFTVTSSSGTDTSTFAYEIFEPG